MTHESETNPVGRKTAFSAILNFLIDGFAAAAPQYGPYAHFAQDLTANRRDRGERVPVEGPEKGF